MKTTGIVICNYNKSNEIVNCIQSVIESDIKDYDIYVVDNCSTDDSVENIRKHFKDQVHLIINQENKGGSGGFNTGVRIVTEKGYRYVWCLDNDVLVDEKALHVLVDFLNDNPETGMAGSKVYNMEDPDVVQQFGLQINFDEYCMESIYHNRIEDGSMPEVVYCDAVPACSLLVRTALIRSIGYMPEENFLYWDDTEWCLRCQMAGYKVASCGNSKVLHSMGAKKEDKNTFPTYYAWRNWIVFFIKFVPQEKLEHMSQKFLHGIFDIIYEGFYRGEKNRARTVMFAYDDALNYNMGKASKDKIFEIDKNDTMWSELLENAECIEVYAGAYQDYLPEFSRKVKELRPNVEIIRKEQYEIDTQANANNRNILQVTFCQNIFYQRDLSLSRIYIDLYGNILQNRGDISKVINYKTSLETFLFEQQHLFLHKARKIREWVKQT